MIMLPGEDVAGEGEGGGGGERDVGVHGVKRRGGQRRRRTGASEWRATVGAGRTARAML